MRGFDSFLAMFCLYWYHGTNSFGSIHLCETMQIALFKPCAHFSLPLPANKNFFAILPFFWNGTKLLIISPFQTSLMGQAVIWTERKLCKYETCFFLAVLYQGLLNMQQCQKRIKKFPYHGFFGSTYDMKLTFVSHYARSYHMY